MATYLVTLSDESKMYIEADSATSAVEKINVLEQKYGYGLRATGAHLFVNPLNACEYCGRLDSDGHRCRGKTLAGAHVQAHRGIVAEMHQSHKLRYAANCTLCAKENKMGLGLFFPKEEGDYDWGDMTETLRGALPDKYHACFDSLVGRAFFNKEKAMRKFESGATRDTDENKIDFEGFLSPQVLRAYGKYMLKHQKQADGQMRTSDNWQKGIPRDAYMKSMFRHFVEVWDMHRAEKWHLSKPVDLVNSNEAIVDRLHTDQEEALCSLLFNVMGYLFELKNDR